MRSRSGTVSRNYLSQDTITIFLYAKKIHENKSENEIPFIYPKSIPATWHKTIQFGLIRSDISTCCSNMRDLKQLVDNWLNFLIEFLPPTLYLIVAFFKTCLITNKAISAPALLHKAVKWNFYHLIFGKIKFPPSHRRESFRQL